MIKMRGVNCRNLSFLLISILFISPAAYALFEDQIGKFDWHQKYFGKIKFIFDDPLQPKRIIVGTEDNVIGALNSNTGAILYRHVFEESSRLLFLGQVDDSTSLSISQCSESNLIKFRTFTISSGIQSDEWSAKELLSPQLSASFSQGLIYLIDSSKKSTLQVYSYEFVKKGGGSKGKKTAFESSDFEQDEPEGVAKTVFKFLSKKEINLGVIGEKCEFFAQFFLCRDNEGNEVRVGSLRIGTVLKVPKEGKNKVNEMMGVDHSGSFSVFSISGRHNHQLEFSYIYKIDQKEGNNLELIPLVYPLSSDSVFSLSISTSGILFITHFTLPSIHSLSTTTLHADAFSAQLEKLDNYSFRAKCNQVLGSLSLSRGFATTSNNKAKLRGIVGFTGDEMLFGTRLEAESTSKDIAIAWTRQECLASVVGAEAADYPSEVDQSWNPYGTTGGLLSSFISRLKYEAESIISGDRFYTSNDDRFGVRKVLILLTSIGKVVGMDGISGQILYAFLLPHYSPFPSGVPILYLQRPAKYTPLPPVATVLYPSSSNKELIVLFNFNPVEGEQIQDRVIQPQLHDGKRITRVFESTQILQTQMLLHSDESTNFLKPILLLDSNKIVHTHPEGFKIPPNVHFFLATTTESGPVLSGYVVKHDASQNKYRAKELWSLKLGPHSLLSVHAKLPCEKVHSQGRVLPDRSVSYKYMNPNLVVVVTGDTEAGGMNLFFIDAVSGALIHSIWHKKARGPVHVVHSEHWVVYSIFNEKHRRYEINSVELHEGPTQSNSSVFSSFSTPSVLPLIIKSSYIFPSKIDFMASTRTDKGITSKDLLIALPSGGLLELPRFAIQPRVGIGGHNTLVQDEDGVVHSVPYIPELPIHAEMILNYNQTVKRVRGVKSWPTRLESTSLVLIYGKDLFFTKTAPSKHFDVLKDDFDHWLILIVLIGLCIGAYVTRRLSIKKLLEQSWR